MGGWLCRLFLNQWSIFAFCMHACNKTNDGTDSFPQIDGKPTNQAGGRRQRLPAGGRGAGRAGPPGLLANAPGKGKQARHGPLNFCSKDRICIPGGVHKKAFSCASVRTFVCVCVFFLFFCFVQQPRKHMHTSSLTPVSSLSPTTTTTNKNCRAKRTSSSS